ncbi:porin [Comamonas aquatica]|uniref:Outer membrane porin protein 32 n=1 Tax=Comamonas aquatica TaxID=225991 RepID=A0AA35D737_9BURK|nr:porin [Comamonas aquatica]CAB5687506.1 Outer membrane porin protein 32 precursor [Comamonas aquatica]CAC9690166.1 Outer membrane porin protein 32 precursor [Comamonas aquatica]
MKKSLIALAAVAASGAAFAQSSVTVYGVVDTSIAVVKGQDSVSGMLNSGAATSRLGFRGVEDLGNGLKANFVLEGEVQPDDGTAGGLNFRRQSTVGLAGSFGEVRLGRALTASYNAVSRYDMFGTVGLGSTLAWNGTQTGYQNRSNNMISYISPKFSGFGVGIDYGFGEQQENRTARYAGIGATYDNGPLSLGLGYDKANNGLAVTGTEDLTTWQLGGSYDLSVVKLAAFYKETKYKEIATGDSEKLKTWNLGVSAPVGAAGVVKAAYNHYKLSDSSAKAQQFSLGYVHNLSKRTALYSTYAFLKNKDGAAFTLNGAFAGAGLTDSGKQQGLQVGVRHAF